jgi:hypothetical protein
MGLDRSRVLLAASSLTVMPSFRDNLSSFCGCSDLGRLLDPEHSRARIVCQFFSHLCSFLFVEESLIHGTSSYRLPTLRGRVTATYFLQR